MGRRAQRIAIAERPAIKCHGVEGDGLEDERGVIHRRHSNVSNVRRVTAVLAVLLVVVAILGVTPVTNAQSLWDELLSGFESVIGAAVAEDVRDEYGQPARLSSAQQRWVDTIFADIVLQAGRKDITYSLQVLDSDVVNAFAAPGGYVFITTGLLRHIGNDADALANVLGHEVAHVEHKHGMNALGRGLGLGLVLQLVFGNPSEGDEVWQVVAGVAVGLMQMGWSRDQEHESDELGQRLAARAGYDPQGMVRFFRVMQELEGAEIPFLEFLSTHPLTSERINRASGRATSLTITPRTQAKPSLPAGQTIGGQPAAGSHSSASQGQVVSRGGGAQTSGGSSSGGQTPGNGSGGQTQAGTGAGGQAPTGSLYIDPVERVTVAGMFEMNISSQWPLTWERPPGQTASDSAQVAEFVEIGERGYMAVFQYDVKIWSTARDTAREWLQFVSDTNADVRVIEFVRTRRINGHDAASFVVSWFENGLHWMHYGTTIVVYGKSYEIGIVYAADGFDERRLAFDGWLESWRLLSR